MSTGAAANYRAAFAAAMVLLLHIVHHRRRANERGRHAADSAT